MKWKVKWQTKFSRSEVKFSWCKGILWRISYYCTRKSEDQELNFAKANELTKELFNDNDKKNEDVEGVENAENPENVENVENTENNDEKNREKEKKVENFIRKNCSEPIENVNKIKPFKNLVNLIIKSAKKELDTAKKEFDIAQKEFDKVKSLGKVSKDNIEKHMNSIKKYRNAKEVRNKVSLFTLPDEEKNKLTDVQKKQIEWLAKDQRIYELPAYKKLIENWWFIIPSDIRTSYDSAGQKPVLHLWVDYNVKAWTEVKSIYDWIVVESTYTWEPWESSLWYKVVVKHKADDWTEFYSLYGHLGSKDLAEKWKKVTKWMKIWEVWAPFTDENWNWEEHLHFQIMKEEKSPEWYNKNHESWQIWNYDVLKAFGKNNKIKFFIKGLLNKKFTKFGN